MLLTLHVKAGLIWFPSTRTGLTITGGSLCRSLKEQSWSSLAAVPTSPQSGFLVAHDSLPQVKVKAGAPGTAAEQGLGFRAG